LITGHFIVDPPVQALDRVRFDARAVGVARHAEQRHDVAFEFGVHALDFDADAGCGRAGQQSGQQHCCRP
jgi:hypothetical protein